MPRICQDLDVTRAFKLYLGDNFRLRICFEILSWNLVWLSSMNFEQGICSMSNIGIQLYPIRLREDFNTLE